jgi:hypothetical protein
MAGDDERTYVERVRANTRAYIEELLTENARLRGELDSLRADLARRDTENRRFEERFVEVERQNANLAALYAASYQLHASLRRAEVLATIQEIVVNLVGSEELVILGLTAGGFEALGSMGVSPETIASLRLDAGLMAAALTSARPEAGEADAAGMTACIPLVVAGRTIGLVGIFGLLPQKPVLEALDMELFCLLAHHAATALYCADLHEAAA